MGISGFIRSGDEGFDIQCRKSQLFMYFAHGQMYMTAGALPDLSGHDSFK